MVRTAVRLHSKAHRAAGSRVCARARELHHEPVPFRFHRSHCALDISSALFLPMRPMQFSTDSRYFLAALPILSVSVSLIPFSYQSFLNQYCTIQRWRRLARLLFVSARRIRLRLPSPLSTPRIALSTPCFITYCFLRDDHMRRK